MSTNTVTTMPHAERHEHEHAGHEIEVHDHGHGALRVRQGDVLGCRCGDCGVELTVTKACTGDACGAPCAVDVQCCGQPMTVRT